MSTIGLKTMTKCSSILSIEHMYPRRRVQLLDADAATCRDWFLM